MPELLKQQSSEVPLDDDEQEGTVTRFLSLLSTARTEPIVDIIQGEAKDTNDRDKLKKDRKGWWWQGALDPTSGCIYYMPGGARRILKFDPRTEKQEWVGKDLGGDEMTWCGCVRAENGCIYGIPANAKQVLKFNPATETAELLPGDITKLEGVPETGHKYVSGALARDGCIYCGPWGQSDRVLQINTKDDTVKTVGPSLTALACRGEKTSEKYLSGTTGSDGCVYMGPHNAQHVLKITPSVDGTDVTVDVLGEAIGSHKNSKWSGGVCGRDGNVYLTPNKEDFVMKIDIEKQTISKIGQDISTLGIESRGWEIGCVGPTGLIYFIPRGSGADYVLLLDIAGGPTPTIKLAGPDLKISSGGWGYNGGGVYYPETRTIYAFHGGKKILRITPPQPELAKQVDYMDVAFLNDEIKNGWYWAPVCDKRTGRIFVMPGGAAQVVVFDPENNTLQAIGEKMTDSEFGGSKYHSACLGPDGMIYAIPCTAKRIMRIDPSKNTVEYFRKDVAQESRVRKFRSAIMAKNGCIYSLPCRDSRIMKVNIKTEEVTFIETEFEADEELYSGGALADDGVIYAPPAHGRRIMKIDTMNEDEISYLGGDLGSGNKFGGAVVGKDGNVYCLPEDYRRVLKIDIRNQEVHPIGDDLGSQCKFPGQGVVGSDGRIYAMPYGFDKVVCIDTESGSLRLIGAEVEIEKHKNACIVLGKNGVMYGFHRFQKPRILRSSPALVSNLTDLMNDHPRSLAKHGLSANPEMCRMTLEYMATILSQAVDPTSPLSIEVKTIRRVVKESREIATNPTVLREVFELELYDVAREIIYPQQNLMALVKFCDASPQYWRHAIIVMARRAAFEPETFGPWCKEWIRRSLMQQDVQRLMELFTEIEQLKAKEEEESKTYPNASGLEEMQQKLEQILNSLENSDIGEVLSCAKGSSGSSNSSMECAIQACRIVLGTRCFGMLTKAKEFKRALYSPSEFKQQTQLEEHEYVISAEDRKGLKDILDDEEFSPSKIEASCREVEGFRNVFEAISEVWQCESEKKVYHDESAKTYGKIIESLDTVLPELLPLVLQLEKKKKEQIAYQNMFHDIVEITLKKDGCICLIFLDGSFLVLLLMCSVVILLLVHAGKPLPMVLVVITFLLNLWPGGRHVFELRTMIKSKILESYLKDMWSWVDILSFLAIVLVCALSLNPSHSGTANFQRATALATFFTWLEFLGYIKSFSRELATFILSISQIMNDLKAFLGLLFCILCMFGSVFFVLLGAKDKDGDDNEDGDAEADNDSAITAPFSTVRETALTMYRMMLGANERSWFESGGYIDLSVIFFFFYSFFVQVLLLSMLIAIVSDSYDFAMIRSFNLFYRARCEQAAKLVAAGASRWDSRPVKAMADFVRGFGGIRSTITTRLFGAPRTYKKPPADQEGADDWQGRALDTERRTRLAVEDSQTALEQSIQEQKVQLKDDAKSMEKRIKSDMEAMKKGLDSVETMQKGIDEKLEAMMALLTQQGERNVASSVESADGGGQEIGGRSSTRSRQSSRTISSSPRSKDASKGRARSPVPPRDR